MWLQRCVLKQIDFQSSYFIHYVVTHAVPVWKVARYTCATPLNIMECDNYTSTDLAQPNLSSLGLRRIRKLYTDTQQSVAISSLVCVEAGQFDAVEMGCVDVPVAALQDSPQWLSSPGAIQRVAQLLVLQHCSAVSNDSFCVGIAFNW